MRYRGDAYNHTQYFEAFECDLEFDFGFIY
jgi:hypothetical protein